MCGLELSKRGADCVRHGMGALTLGGRGNFALVSKSR